jgi:hypothetical protein
MTRPLAPGPGCPVDAAFDPLSAEFLADPYAVLATLPPAADRPVFFAPSIGYYVVTRYAEIDQVFKDPGTYSAAVGRRRSCRWCPRRNRSCSLAATSRSRRWSASTSPSTPGCAVLPPARSP